MSVIIDFRERTQLSVLEGTEGLVFVRASPGGEDVDFTGTFEVGVYEVGGVVEDPRFTGEINSIVGDFGVVFYGSFAGMFEHCFIGSIRGNVVGNAMVRLNTTNANSMFESANSDDWSFLDNFDVSRVTDMDSMFRESNIDGCDLTGWDVSNVTTMNRMFQEAAYFNGDISTWNTGHVTSMSYMFADAIAFNQPIENLDTSFVEDMSFMFDGAINFDQHLSFWDTTSVNDMSAMFRNARSFNGDIADWDVSMVLFMNSMFCNASAFDCDLSDWDVANVQDTMSMFLGATSFNVDGRHAFRVAVPAPAVPAAAVEAAALTLETTDVKIEGDCVVCMEEAKSPVLLHAFKGDQAKHFTCRSCFDTMRRITVKSFLECPICREKFNPADAFACV